MSKLKEVHLRWIGIPILALVFTVLEKQQDHPEWTFLESFGISLLFTAVLWNGCFLIISWYRRLFRSIRQTPIRILLTFSSVSFWLILGANVLALSLGLCTIENIKSPEYFFRHGSFNLTAGFFISTIYEAVFFFHQWKKSVQLNEELKNQQIRTQFEVLQNQMSPHFLFNSLNTLTTLIAEDQKTAIDFTQTLSEVYRYILQNKERELVSLHEEVEFSRSYVFLLKKRYPENLHVDFDISQNFKEYHIAPLTLQMLIENAIKHNSVSKTEPLRIEIYIDDNEAVVVKNNLQLKRSLEKSTKTGLANIKKRYAYLGNREIDIRDTDGEFKVSVPLIHLLSELEYTKAVGT